MKRGFLKKPKASPKNRAQKPSVPSQSSNGSTSDIKIMPASQELRDTLRWMLSERRDGLDGRFVFSEEFVSEMVTTVEEITGDSIEDPMQFAYLVKEISQEILKERPVKKSSNAEGLTTGAAAGNKSSSGSQTSAGTYYSGTKLDHAEDVVVVTTIPLPPNDNDLDPDGHCQWIVNGPTKAKVVLAPGYPAPVPKPSARKMTIRQTTDMGVGLFALKDMKMGELIFAERPILAMCRAIGRLDGPDYREAWDQKSSEALAMAENEELLRETLDRMNSTDRNAFLRLKNTHTKDGSGPLVGIIRTNGFVLDGLFDGPEEKKDGTNIYTGVLKIGSYINHRCVPVFDVACTPNIRGEFKIPSFSFQFYANVDIEAGQQLFVSYCETDMSVADRRKKLASYGFTCHCDACDQATDETDKLRQEYKSKTNRLLRALNWQRREGKKIPQATIDSIIKLKNALAKEGLVFTHEYKSIVVILAKAFEELGKEDLAKEYNEEGQKYDLSKESLAKYGF